MVFHKHEIFEKKITEILSWKLKIKKNTYLVFFFEYLKYILFFKGKASCAKRIWTCNQIDVIICFKEEGTSSGDRPMLFLLKGKYRIRRLSDVNLWFLFIYLYLFFVISIKPPCGCLVLFLLRKKTKELGWPLNTNFPPQKNPKFWKKP